MKVTSVLRASYRAEVVEVEFAFGAANIAVRVFEDSEEQVLFAAEVVVDHLLIGFGATGDCVHAGAGQSVTGEFDLGGIEDALLRCFGVAGPGLRARGHSRFSVCRHFTV